MISYKNDALKQAAPSAHDGAEWARTLDELNGTLNAAGTLLRRLDSELVLPPDRSAEMQTELETVNTEMALVKKDRDLLASQLSDAVVQTARSMNLYVATYQLHGTLDPEEVLEAIAEIVGDLIGAKSFMILLRDRETDGWKVALQEDLPTHTMELLSGSQYRGGDPVIDATLADSRLRVEAHGNESAIAAVPLRMEHSIVGVLAVFRILAHKVDGLNEDRELLDMLSDHAGSALLAAEVFTSTRRRLKTLDQLVGLLPGN
jgi:transcriptional regulator with GAF, ATPase, and Fis domain